MGLVRPSPAVDRGRRRAGSALRVLVVDDNVDAAELLRDALAMLGHDAAVALDGGAALAQAASFRPDVVLLDLGLPDMDGFEVARRLREDGATARLVALTGYGQLDDRERTRAAGFDLHLVKPVDLAGLEAAFADLRRLDASS